MAFYSFIVFNESGDVVTIPKHLLVLDRGRNVFSAVVNDLEAFTETLKTAGVRVHQSTRLDEYDAVDPLQLTE